MSSPAGPTGRPVAPSASRIRPCDRYPEWCWPVEEGGPCFHDTPQYLETLEYKRDQALDAWAEFLDTPPWPVKVAARVAGLFRPVVHWWHERTDSPK